MKISDLRRLLSSVDNDWKLFVNDNDIKGAKLDFTHKIINLADGTDNLDKIDLDDEESVSYTSNIKCNL